MSMNKQVVTKKVQAGNSKKSLPKRTNGRVMNHSAVPKMILLSEIEPDPENVRQQADDDDFMDLVNSIKEIGVLQAILLRPTDSTNGSKAKYRIVAGERRFRAAKRAGLTEIPALAMKMNECEPLGAQLNENLQRKDLHPLDEADGILRLKIRENLDVSGLAGRLGKKARYVARRLALTDLIDEAREDFLLGRITLGHALEICRLTPEVQADAIAACYESKIVIDRKSGASSYVPDKDSPAHDVGYLKEWLQVKVYLNLQKAPFKKHDPSLREDGLTCIACPQRTGHNTMLFDDFDNSDTCLNPPCFEGKIRRLVQIKQADLEAKAKKPVALLSDKYGSGVNADESLRRGSYQIIERKAPRCQHVEKAVFSDGQQIGHVKDICREPTCKDHLGRVPERHSHSRGNGVRSTSPKDNNRRRQELFDMKVDEKVRKLVMAEALKTYSWPLDRADLNEVVNQFFSRLPSEHQETIIEVLGWNKNEDGKFRFDEKVILDKLAGLSDAELAQFLMLCSFAHFGANRYGGNRVDQSQVVRLAKARGVNYALVDGQVRFDLCAKKYKADHRAYLEAVKNGKSAKMPVVYEQPGKSGQTLAGAAAENGKD
jgi:ParB family transcriptional regulator, chromosome partitioning protein